jgi:adenylate cyclase
MQAERVAEGATASTIVRSIERAAVNFGLSDEPAEFDEKHRVLDAAYANRDFRALVRFARELIRADTVAAVLAGALDVAFGTLPVHRGAILLRQATGELVCELARIRDRVEHRPEGESFVSRTIIERAMNDRVAIVTQNALDDERFSNAESIWRRGTRAAICVPLWSGERIIGVMYVDSPLWARSLNERDVDFFVALANVTAVAVERIREHHARARLQRYHAPAIVEQVLRDETAMSAMQRLCKTEVTVLFADLVGFTAIAESAAPEQVADLLAGFCTRTAEAVFAEGGTLDKFLGDCVMAFFGAPIELPNHAVQGVQAALRILEAIEHWNRERVSLGLPALRVRVGVNSGPVVVGEVGNERRADYSVIGNTVNIAARLEQSVAGAGEIVVGEGTRQLLGDVFDLEPLGEVELRGLAQRIAAHRGRRPTGTAATPPGPPDVPPESKLK